MIVRLRHWYLARTARERRLVQVMAAIAIPLLVWLLLVRPLGNLYQDALQQQLEAVDRNGRVKALAERAGDGPATVPAAVPDLALFVIDSARQRGISAEARAGTAPGSAAVSIASAPAPIALDWLRGLESQGYVLSDVRVTPAGSGAVAISATLAGPAR